MKDVFIHFSDLPKLGINPQSKFDTPIGIYGYPLTSDIWLDLLERRIPFAQHRTYIHVFRISPPPKNMEEISDEDIQKAIKYTKERLAMNDEYIRLTFEQAREPLTVEVEDVDGETYKLQPTLASKFWNLTRVASKTPVRWNKTLRDLGYSGFVDDGFGIIHPNEKQQGFALTGANTQLLVTIKNPPIM